MTHHINSLEDITHDAKRTMAKVHGLQPHLILPYYAEIQSRFDRGDGEIVLPHANGSQYRFIEQVLMSSLIVNDELTYHDEVTFPVIPKRLRPGVASLITRTKYYGVPGVSEQMMGRIECNGWRAKRVRPIAQYERMGRVFEDNLRHLYDQSGTIRLYAQNKRPPWPDSAVERIFEEMHGRPMPPE